MATEHERRLGTGVFTLDIAGAPQRYWIAFMRVIVGWWFFHAGITKIIESGFNYGYGPMYLQGMEGTSLGPLATFMGNNLAWLVKPGVPLFETLIGLGLLFGVLTRLASVGGMFFMSLFWVGNGGFKHGLVNGDLFGLLLFATLLVFAAGRYYGLDGYLEQTDFVQNHPRLGYLMG